LRTGAGLRIVEGIERAEKSRSGRPGEEGWAMSTGTKDHQLPQFSGDDDPTLYYKPVSTMAVISLLLGIASLGSYFSLGLWVLLPFAIIISSITSYRLERAISSSKTN
jgi:hypothetical protein